MVRKERNNMIELGKREPRYEGKKYIVKACLNKLEKSKDYTHLKMLNQRQSLPPITSPFLKKTVYGLFSDKNFKQAAPLQQD